MKQRVALVLAAGLLAHQPAFAESLAPAKPEEVGFSGERLQRIVKRLRADAEKAVIPGGVLLIARKGKVALFEAVGKLDPESGAPMTKDAIFRIHSMTKPIATVAAMMLVEEGRLSLAEPVAKYLPQFAKPVVGVEKTDAAGGKTLEFVPARRPISIHDLMRHSSGLTYEWLGTSLVKKAHLESGLLKGEFSNAEFVDRLAKLPLAYQPGTTWDYGYSTDVLGRVLEVIEGKTLFQVMRARVLDPLGMKDTTYVLRDPEQQKRLAMPLNSDRVTMAGVALRDPRDPQVREAGGSALVSTAMDYARFLQMLLNGGELDGKRYLGPRTVAYMTADHLGAVIVPGAHYIPPPGYGFGLGFAVRRDAGVASSNGSPGDYYWGGSGGTLFWVDPRRDMFVVFMMQAPRQLTPYGRLLRDMVYAALVD